MKRNYGEWSSRAGRLPSGPGLVRMSRNVFELFRVGNALAIADAVHGHGRLHKRAGARCIKYKGQREIRGC